MQMKTNGMKVGIVKRSRHALLLGVDSLPVIFAKRSSKS